MSELEQKVIQANIDLHTRLAGQYNATEPHFRTENVSRVSERFGVIAARVSASRQLDLGCGTGFMINIGKRFVNEIVGIDVTQAMLDKVDKSGDSTITLINADTGTHEFEPESFDLVTAYSFLHHLYDIRPTVRTALHALKPGGIFYADLDPNAEYWEAIGKLHRNERNDPIIARELEQVTHKDEDIREKFGIDADTFNHAEYNKNISGGFRAVDLRQLLIEEGFSDVEIFHQWFVGEGFLINDESLDRQKRFEVASIMSEMLQRVMPLSQHLFKYLGFFATK